ncbi:uncharacterized protein [Lolium perenne]|uniref:uncharacterized protein n=1 Tax=Lolium perenne TaxID=4522 RepID=UPI003A9932C1
MISFNFDSKTRKVPGWIGWTRIVPCVCSSSAELQPRNGRVSPATVVARSSRSQVGRDGYRRIDHRRLMVHSMLFHSHCRGAGGCGIRTIRVRINSSRHRPLPLISLEYMIASERKVLWLMGSFSIFVWPWAMKMNLLRISSSHMMHAKRTLCFSRRIKAMVLPVLLEMLIRFLLCNTSLKL